jgi:protein-S-isoprenylcysteine O-methyltransferase Ste14
MQHGISPARKRALIRGIAFRLVGLFAAFALILFVPAGSLRYWAGWAYCAVLAVPMTLVISYFLRHDPAFLERRIRHREKETAQKRIVAVGSLLFVAGFVVSALDFRFGWSAVPVWEIAAADALVLASYSFIFSVFRVNSYASRIVEVEKRQRVVSSGPYGVVRHPMYTGVIVMYLATPVALGSWWGVLPMLSIPVILVIRLLNEEKVLARGLPGYSRYLRKVRYRLVPGIW